RRWGWDVSVRVSPASLFHHIVCLHVPALHATRPSPFLPIRLAEAVPDALPLAPLPVALRLCLHARRLHPCSPLILAANLCNELTNSLSVCISFGFRAQGPLSISC